jgi:hypothetical protein
MKLAKPITKVVWEIMTLSLHFYEFILPKEYVVLMNGENHLLVKNEPMNLRNTSNWLKFKTLRILPTILEESMEYISNW